MEKYQSFLPVFGTGPPEFILFLLLVLLSVVMELILCSACGTVAAVSEFEENGFDPLFFWSDTLAFLRRPP
jgi:hypothetical protein